MPPGKTSRRPHRLHRCGCARAQAATVLNRSPKLSAWVEGIKATALANVGGVPKACRPGIQRRGTPRRRAATATASSGGAPSPFFDMMTRWRERRRPEGLEAQLGVRLGGYFAGLARAPLRVVAASTAAICSPATRSKPRRAFGARHADCAFAGRDQHRRPAGARSAYTPPALEASRTPIPP